MIKHIVCFKLKDNSLAECEKARDVLMSMEGKVPELRGIKVGIDFLHSERSYDLILEVVFDDENGVSALDESIECSHKFAYVVCMKTCSRFVENEESMFLRLLR